MKKIALLLVLVLVTAPMVFAQAKKAAPAPERVVSRAPEAPAVAGSNRIGVLVGAAPAGFGTIGTVGMSFNEALSGDLGLAVGQNAAGANTGIGVVLRLEWKQAKIGEVQTYAGGNLMYSSNSTFTAGGASSITLNGFAGVEYFLTKNLALTADLTLLEITSSGGTTTLGVLAGTPFPGTGITATMATIYGGARLYL